MVGGTRSQGIRELRKPAVRGLTRTRASIVNERSATPQAPLRPTSANMARLPRSPSEHSQAGVKRKERDFEHDAPTSDTNIRVIVRCRGRSDREVKENSGVVVSTEGVRGTTVELSMGPNSMGNKAYTFDKVFSPAADQAILFEDVVVPIISEMLAGYNCTIFAYGQTGTGKTYTMSGDMTETLGLLSDGAGIAPRVLYSLFQKLEDTDSTVKCSLIELYNEELKDLLSSEENVKLKIYEDGAKKGHNATMVQGVGETYIDSASAGIKLLREGNHKRQVAATKCNDLSSRSHTVFTITVYTKRTTDKGEEYISSGKLNLVDLAGSENIQRSGAEHKRAAEAGLINKSLLTLGRVINALVDKSPHIPYRESKLTRLLQDSLGGRTKTCIITTISSARSNLEETMSTLDYAFRAKNIRNKPQINSSMSKKTLLKEFTSEIEKLRSDLIATRQRNGVYLSAGAYEEMTVESESRRILSEEQRAKIETMEINLKNKVQDFFALTGNFNKLKKENESTRNILDQTQDLLQQTEVTLDKSQKELEAESLLRQAHENTENRLREIGTSLLSSLEQSVTDVTGLHANISRRSNIQSQNKSTWEHCAASVIDAAKSVDNRMTTFHSRHSSLLEGLFSRMEALMEKERVSVETSRSIIQHAEGALTTFKENNKNQNSKSRDDMNDVLENIKTLREEVEQRLGEGLNGLSSAATRISGEVILELQQYDSELNSTYTLLSNDFAGLFKSITEHLRTQKMEVERLRKELQDANERTLKVNEKAASQLQSTLEEERRTMEAERNALARQIQNMLQESNDRQTARLKKNINSVRSDINRSCSSMRESHTLYHDGMEGWDRREDQLFEKVLKSEAELKARIKDNMELLISKNTSIHNTANTVHEETVRIVDEQKKDTAIQMGALDDFVSRVQIQNDSHCEEQNEMVDMFSVPLGESYGQLYQMFTELKGHGETLQADTHAETEAMANLVSNFIDDVKNPLSELESQIQKTSLIEYKPTGSTPPKRKYSHITELPRTEPHGNILARLRSADTPTPSPPRSVGSVDSFGSPRPRAASPTKALVYHDTGDKQPVQIKLAPADSPHKGDTLREVDINVVNRPTTALDGSFLTANADVEREAETVKGAETNKGLEPPPLKRHLSASVAAAANLTGDTKIPTKRITRRHGNLGLGMVVEGRENLLVPGRGTNLNGKRVRSGPN
ncbi:kinesin motor protein cin8 [Myotisia sp. PD_48]|nr:kinesin motor protein cin8 [Myotisia sp. PD_48]